MKKAIRRLYEDTKETTVIDGFVLGTENTYIITKEWVIRKFKVFNEKYFEGKLNIDKINIDVSKKNFVGLFSCIAKYDSSTGRVFSTRNEKLEINDDVCRSEVAFSEILLHEMIHMYNEVILKQLDIDPIDKHVDPHGESFIQKMKELNKRGWNIEIEESDEQFKNRGKVNMDSIKQFEEVNDVSKYSIIFYIPKSYYLNSQVKREKVYFQVLKLSEWEGKNVEEIIYIMENSLESTCRFTNTSFIKKGGNFSKWMEIGGFFKEDNRICAKDFSEKIMSKETLLDNKIVKDYLNSRTFQLSYNYFIEFIKDKEILLVNNNLIEELFKSERITESLEAMTEEEIIKSIESPYFKVRSAKYLGKGIIEIDNSII